MFCKDYVWYLGYGSNIDKERFLCYIRGGQPDGCNKPYHGCRDRTLPKCDKKFIFHNELYFAKKSPKWNYGGVAFIKLKSSEQVKTFGRIYLIKRQQFEDIAKQETDSSETISINFDEAINNRNTIFKQNSWYGKVIYFENKFCIPIFTFTNENNLTDFQKPAESYILTIKRGLQQIYKLNEEDLINYFITTSGIDGNYTREELTNIIKGDNTNL